MGKPRISELSFDDRDAAVEVLAAAFHDYPVMRYALGDAGDEYDRRLRALVGFFTDKRFANGWPVLGVRDGNEIVAVALISKPDHKTTPSLADMERGCEAIIGEAAWERMRRFERASDANEPEGPHYFVGMLATMPGHQGRGYGKALLQAAMDMAVDAGAFGVCLSTEDADNVPMYVHLGFEVVSEVDVDEIHSWSLRWPNPEYQEDLHTGDLT
jgi:GNAT superfamily N-acetyltransferase